MWEQGVLAWRFRAARTAGLYRRALSDSVPEPARGPRARRVRTSRSADRAFFALDILRFGVRLLRLYSIFRCLALRSLFALLSIGCDRGRTMRPCESCTRRHLVQTLELMVKKGRLPHRRGRGPAASLVLTTRRRATQARPRGHIARPYLSSLRWHLCGSSFVQIPLCFWRSGFAPCTPCLDTMSGLP